MIWILVMPASAAVVASKIAAVTNTAAVLTRKNLCQRTLGALRKFACPVRVAICFPAGNTPNMSVMLEPSHFKNKRSHQSSVQTRASAAVAN
jgi:hypothetical protein